jgi:hypothetical protein
MKEQMLKLELAPEFPLWMLTGEDPNIFYPINFDPFPKAGKSFLSGSSANIKQEGYFSSKKINDSLHAAQTFLLGASLIDAGGALYLHINDAARFMQTIADGKVFGMLNGKEVIWKAGFYGNQSVDTKIVSDIKNIFFNQAAHLDKVKGLKLFKYTKNLGRVGDILNLGVKSVDLIKEPTGEKGFDLSVTLLLIAGGAAAAGAMATGAAVAGVSVATAPFILLGAVVLIPVLVAVGEIFEIDGLNGTKNMYNFISQIF